MSEFVSELGGAVTRPGKALRAAAYHEAGHVVAAFVRGIETGEVSIVANREAGTGGHVIDLPKPDWFNPDWDDSPETVERLEGEIIFCCGGPAAEARLLGSYNWDGASADTHLANDRISYLCGPDEEEGELKRLLAKAEALIEEHWPKVEALAAVLLERKRLTGAEAIAVIEPSPWWQATGVARGVPCVIRWEDGLWTAEGGGDASDVLWQFLDGMHAAGYGSEAEQGIPPDIWGWLAAAEVSARGALPGHVIFTSDLDSEFVEGRVYGPPQEPEYGEQTGDDPVLEHVATIDLAKLAKEDPDFYAELMPRRADDPATAPDPPADQAPVEQPPWWWQASGLIVGVHIIIRWDDGTFSVQGDPPGWRTAEDILAMFLRDLLYEGEGDGISPVVGPGIALMGSGGQGFFRACEAAAKATMPGHIVFDCELGIPDPDRLD